MSEPVYDEDWVNLGYLKRTVDDTDDQITKRYETILRPLKPHPDGRYAER